MGNWITDRTRFATSTELSKPDLVRQGGELGPYETFYFDTRTSIGVQGPLWEFEDDSSWKSYWNVGVEYVWVGGDEENVGSHSHEIHALLGFRQNIIKHIFVEGNFLIGPSFSKFNYGKAIPLIEYEMLDIGAQAKVGAEYCISGENCISAFISFVQQYGFLDDPGYILSSFGGGFGVSLGATGNGCYEDLSEVEPKVQSCSDTRKELSDELASMEKKLHQRLSSINQKSDEVVEFSERFQERCSMVSVVAPKFEISIPQHVSFEKWVNSYGACQEVLKSAELYLNRCGDGTAVNSQFDAQKKIYETLMNRFDQIEDEINEKQMQTEADIERCIDKANVRQSISIVLPINFANDNPDFELNPQWFAGKNGELSRCFSAPILDQYMRNLYAWTLKERELKRGYEIRVKVYGYANDTGTKERQIKLGKARADGVVDYMVGNKAALSSLPPIGDGPFARQISQLQAVDGALGKIQTRMPEVVGKESDKRISDLKDAGIDYHALSRFNTCGALTHDGDETVYLGYPEFDGYVTVVNSTSIVGDPLHMIRTAFEVSDPNDLKNPNYRTVRLEFFVYENAGGERRLVTGREAKKVLKEIGL